MPNMTDATTLTGAEMREILFPKLEAETNALCSNLPKTPEIARRIVRVYLRFAAKLALGLGMPPEMFVGEALFALKNEHEAAHESPEVDSKPPPNTLLN